MTRTYSIAGAMMLTLVAAQVARATSWPLIPLEVLVDEATLIVEGEVSEIKAPGFDVPDTRPQELAVIKVANILKALPGVGKPKEIGVLQPAPSMGLVVSGGDLRFSVGQKAVWLVRKDPNLPAYRITHPFQVQPAGDTKKLTELVKAREKLPGGKAVAGLVARAEVIEHKPAEGVGGDKSYEVRFSLKNVSDKPMAVFDFVGARPLAVDWTGPEGQKLESQHYEWLKAARLRAPDKSNFATIPPGGVHVIGSGIYFGSAEIRGGSVIPAGKNKIVVSYHSEEDGKRFGAKDGWTGTVTANEVEIKAGR